MENHCITKEEFIQIKNTLRLSYSQLAAKLGIKIRQCMRLASGGSNINLTRSMQMRALLREHVENPGNQQEAKD